jgi:hypothetical protein
MLSEYTKGHIKTRKVMRFAFWILLIVTIVLVFYWIQNPTIDTTSSQLQGIQQTLVDNNKETNQKLQELINKIDGLIQMMEARNTSESTIPTK